MSSEVEAQVANTNQSEESRDLQIHKKTEDNKNPETHCKSEDNKNPETRCKSEDNKDPETRCKSEDYTDPENHYNSEDNTDPENHYKYLPARSSRPVNAVKHVFRKADEVFLVLEDFPDGNLTINFHEADEGVLKPNFVGNVYSYVFNWSGTVRETFSVNFSAEKVESGNFDRKNSYSLDRQSTCLRPFSTESTTSEEDDDDDDPYDRLPVRSEQRGLNSFPLKDSLEKPPDDFKIDIKTEKTSKQTCDQVTRGTDKLSSLQNSEPGDSDDLSRAGEFTHDKETGTLEDTLLSASPSTETLKEYPATDQSFSDLAAEESKSDSSCDTVMTVTEKSSLKDLKLQKLRSLLEDELTLFNTVYRPVKQYEDNEVVFRHPIERSVSNQSETVRSTVCSTIEEEQSLPDENGKSANEEDEVIFQQNSTDEDDSYGVPADTDDDIEEEDVAKLTCNEPLETVAEKSEMTDRSTSLMPRNRSSYGNVSKKPSLKQRIKKMMHKSSSEPKMKIVVESALAAEKKKMSSLATSDSAVSKDFLTHSASEGGLQDHGRKRPGSQCKKKRKGKKQTD